MLMIEKIWEYNYIGKTVTRDSEKYVVSNVIVNHSNDIFFELRSWSGKHLTISFAESGFTTCVMPPVQESVKKTHKYTRRAMMVID
jgi:hypothetical protein